MMHFDEDEEPEEEEHEFDGLEAEAAAAAAVASRKGERGGEGGARRRTFKRRGSAVQAAAKADADAEGEAAAAGRKRVRRPQPLPMLWSASARGPGLPPLPRMRRVRSAANLQPPSPATTPRSAMRSAEFLALSERIRALHIEVGRLSRRQKEAESDSVTLVRYSRRAVIAINVALGAALLVSRFVRTIRQRSTDVRGPLGVLYRALFASGRRDGGRLLSAIAAAACFRAFQGGMPYFASAVLFTRREAWKRNSAHVLSAGASLWLMLWARDAGRGHTLNMVANALHLVTRYYMLHGLLSFGKLYIS